MAENTTFIRVDVDDPNRCQSNNSFGQCTMKALPDLKYCKMHAACGDHSLQKKKANQYKLQLWQSRMEEFRDNNDIKCLRDEIGILRLSLEQVINLCDTPNKLFLNSNKISDLCMRIKELVQACHKLEISTGNLLDRSQIVNIANVIVNVVSQHVEDSDELEIITADILKGIENVSTLGSLQDAASSRPSA